MNEYTIHIITGTTYKATLEFTNDDGTPISLVDYIPRLQIRANANSDLLLECQDFTITDNRLDFTISKEQTITLHESIAYYNLDISKNDEIIPLLSGKVLIKQNINQ